MSTWDHQDCSMRIPPSIWLLITLVYLGLGLLTLVALQELPRLGVTAVKAGEEAWIVNRVEPGSATWTAGIWPGDEVLELDGQPAAAVDGVPRLQQVVVMRKDGQILRAVAERSSAYQSTAMVFALFGASLIFFVVGSLVLHRGPRRGAVTVFFFLCLAASVSLMIAPITWNGPLWATITERVALMWVTALFPLFFLLFPQQAVRLPLISWLAPGTLVATTVIMSILHLAAHLWEPLLYSAVRQLALGYMVLGAMLGTVLLTYSYVQSPDPQHKEQIRITVFGGVLSAGPLAFLSLVPLATGWYQSVPPTQTVLASVALPLSMGYAIMRHQLFGIRRLVHRGAVYGLLTVVTLGLYSAFMVAASRVMPPELTSGFVGQALILFAVFLGVSGYERIRRLAGKFVDMVLYEDRYDYREAIQAVGLQAALTSNLSQLGNEVLPTIQKTVGADFALLLTDEGSQKTVCVAAGAVPDGLEGWIWGRWRHSSIFELPLEGTASSLLCATLLGDRVGKGLLCLGPKRSGEPFSPDDQQLLKTVANQLTIIIDKLRLLDELEQQVAALRGAGELLEEQRTELKQLTRRLVQTQEEERSRIALYLHDEPLQKALILHRAANDRDIARVAAMAGELASDLRDFSVRLRPAMLDDLGLVSTLEWLCEEVAKSASFEVELDTSGLDEAIRLPPDAELALYRVAQEALANCQKHSQASHVSVKLTATDGEIWLIVSDDGVGVGAPGSRRNRQAPQLGIAGMRERVEALGGTLEVTSNKPQGTRVKAAVPVSQERQRARKERANGSGRGVANKGASRR